MEDALAQLRDMGLDPAVIKELDFEDRDRVLADPPPLPPRPVGRAWGFRVLFGVPFLLFGAGAGIAMLVTGNLFLLIHTLAFGTVGFVLTVFGYRTSRRWRDVVRDGQPTQGAVTATGYDGSMRLNGRPAYRLRYSYEVGARRYDGKVSTFAKEVERYSDGDGLWVLYDPEEPSVSAPWPALRPG